MMSSIMFTAIASVTLGYTIMAAMTFMRNNENKYQREKAFYFAEAGLAASIMALNEGGDGIIGLLESRSYFQSTNRFIGMDWGFSTTVTNVGTGQYRVHSSGVYRQEASKVATVVADQDGDTIHVLYAHALYAGNSSGDTNYVLEVGGTGGDADYVNGDTYSGNDINITGDAILRNPEIFVDGNSDSLWNELEPWMDLHVVYDPASTNVWPVNFPGAVSLTTLILYLSENDFSQCYGNGIHDPGEAYIDSIGNSVYDPAEPFADENGDGEYNFGEGFTDTDGNGVRDAGEDFTDLGNGVYEAGEEFEDSNGNGQWDGEVEEVTEWRKVWYWRWSCWCWSYYWNQIVIVSYLPAEPFEDAGNNVYDIGEAFVDGNGVYDEGEPFADDRNGVYDYGTQAVGDIYGMPPASTGQFQAVGHVLPITPPDLSNMFYHLPKTVSTPLTAYRNWGHDFDVAAQSFGANGRINDGNNPAHIFVKNATGRTYMLIPGKDDYFLEDPTDSTWNNGISVSNPGGTPSSLTMRYLDVNSNGNHMVYYVDGNVYLHNPSTHIYMFRDSGIRITIVANGNITFSDEFYYNGGLGSGASAPALREAGVTNAQDVVAFIALKDPTEPNSGNIYLGDTQFGTGGDIHSFLYAENNFVDNNLDEEGQPFLSVFGNMTAGNHVLIDRSPPGRTRLDITLDQRIIHDRVNLPPGLAPALSGERAIIIDEEWAAVIGSWEAFSPL